MSGIKSTVCGVSDRAYKNASLAYIRDPRRSLRLLDFITKTEREQLLFESLGSVGYERWLEAREREYLESSSYDYAREEAQLRLVELRLGSYHV